MSEPRKYRTLAIVNVDSGMGENDGVIYCASDWKKDDIRATGPRRIMWDVVASHLDELRDGEDVTITFARTDMTKADIDAIPEV